MTTDTLTLSAFLLARIADDEAAARAATKGPWFVEAVGDFGDKTAVIECARWRGGLVNTANFDDDFPTAEHIARNDPARVLAQCAALRAVVALHEPTHWSEGVSPERRGFGCSSCYAYRRYPEHGQAWREPVDFPCPTLRALAQIWSSHPSFDPSWGAS